MNDKTIRIVPHEKCTGCGACFNICPKSAIRMKADKEGFLYPSIEEPLCVHCGKCEQICPALHPNFLNTEDPECFAMMAKDDVRRTSSSGGVFSLVADWIFKQGGVVCGAAYSDDVYSVQHKLVHSKVELVSLMGSKYTQSLIGTVYSEIKELLNSSRPVLFTGTPCQVAGIHAFLEKEYDNLYTMDLICHGVPSPTLYEQFVREEETKHNSKAVKVSFRDKSIAGWEVATSIDFENGDRYTAKRSECPYMKAFLSLASLRKSCGHCPFAALPRQGDLTLGDFWDINKFDPALDDKKGTSLVLCNNEKGEKLLHAITADAIRMKKIPIDFAVKHNAQIKFSSLHNEKRDRFYDLINTYHYSLEKAVDYGLNRRFDIGYVGWWYGANYGSALTSFAMNRVLKAMGKTVLMLDYPIVGRPVPRRKEDKAARRFGKHFYEESRLYPIEEYKRFNYHCETFLVGSDQLWNWYSNRDVGSYHYFLDFADAQHKKIAYSTSFGHEYVYYPENMRLTVGYLLSRFDAISVREDSAVEVCRRDFGVDAAKTVDPVFLCDIEDYKEAISLSNLELKEPFVLAYILTPTQEKIDAVKFIAEQKHFSYRIILDGQDDFNTLKKQVNDENVIGPVEIADWLKYFYCASYVVTDSFHGFCFSIIFKKNMTVIPNQMRGLTRFDSLAKSSGLSNRLVYSYAQLLESSHWTQEIDFAQVEKSMAPEIEFSRSWLKNALEMRKLPPSTNELQRWKILEMDRFMQQMKKTGKAEEVLPGKSETVVASSETEILRRKVKEQEDLIVALEERLARYDKWLFVPKKVYKAMRSVWRKLFGSSQV